MVPQLLQLLHLQVGRSWQARYDSNEFEIQVQNTTTALRVFPKRCRLVPLYRGSDVET